MDNLPANKAINTLITLFFIIAFIGEQFRLPPLLLLAAAGAGVLLFLVRIAKGYD